MGEYLYKRILVDRLFYFDIIFIYVDVGWTTYTSQPQQIVFFCLRSCLFFNFYPFIKPALIHYKFRHFTRVILYKLQCRAWLYVFNVE